MAKAAKPKLKAVPEEQPEVTTEKNAEDKINVTVDEFLSKHHGFAERQTKIGSEQGYLREDIGEFVKDANIHPKAASHMRVGLNIKDEQARNHYFRSILHLAPDLLLHCIGQSTTEMDFGEGEK